MDIGSLLLVANMAISLGDADTTKYSPQTSQNVEYVQTQTSGPRRGEPVMPAQDTTGQSLVDLQRKYKPNKNWYLGIESGMGLGDGLVKTFGFFGTHMKHDDSLKTSSPSYSLGARAIMGPGMFGLLGFYDQFVRGETSLGVLYGKASDTSGRGIDVDGFWGARLKTSLGGGRNGFKGVVEGHIGKKNRAIVTIEKSW